MNSFQRHQIDIPAYIRESQQGPCFICKMLEGDPAYAHHIVFEDPRAVVFLNKYPTLYGYTLVAPREHREHVTGDFTVDEYLELQSLLYCVAEAVRIEISAERVYLLSLGSQQGNSHVHWHVATLPPGVAYHEQQTEAISFKKGCLNLSEDEFATLSLQLRRRLDQLMDKRISAMETSTVNGYLCEDKPISR